MPNTSRPTSSASVIASSNSLRCRAGSMARPAASTVAATKLSTPISISDLLCDFLPERLQSAAPRDELIEHVIDRLFLCWPRLKNTEVFEIGKHREQNLVAHGGHLHLGQYQTQVLDRAHSADAAVADEATRLVVPFGEKKIDRVLKRARDAMVVLGRDENVGIERADLGGPCFSVRLTVLPHHGRHWLVEKRQVEIFDIYEFELSVAALFRNSVDPFRYGLAVSTRAGASDNDRDLNHMIFLVDGVF